MAGLLLSWLRAVFGKFRKKGNGSEADKKEGQVKGRKSKRVSLLPSLVAVTRRKWGDKRNDDDDDWATLFLDEDVNWMEESDQSEELRPVITGMKRVPALPVFVNRVEGSTDFGRDMDEVEEENVGTFYGQGTGQPFFEEIPLAEVDGSRYLLQVAGIQEEDLTEEARIEKEDFEVAGDKIGEIDQERQSLISYSTDTSNMSILSLLQYKYEKRVKRRLKYEAIHELTSRAKEKLKTKGKPVPPQSSYSSLTSSGGDFKLKLPDSFYGKIGATNRKQDERRRCRQYPWVKAVTKDLRETAKDPAKYLMSKWLGSKRPKRFASPTKPHSTTQP